MNLLKLKDDQKDKLRVKLTKKYDFSSACNRQLRVLFLAAFDYNEYITARVTRQSLLSPLNFLEIAEKFNFPQKKDINLKKLFKYMPTLKPRFYSACSDTNEHKTSLRLCFTIENFCHRKISDHYSCEKEGVASNYMKRMQG